LFSILIFSCKTSQANGTKLSRDGSLKRQFRYIYVPMKVIIHGEGAVRGLKRAKLSKSSKICIS
jgi:hypothetical protein